MGEFIYTMKNVRKAIGDKVILDNVTMAFYPGAKIGVVGPNGAGKSSILKIMAGLDQPSNGEAFLDPGATVGILQQEPPLNEEKTVRENVEEGLGDIFEKKQRFEQSPKKWQPTTPMSSWMKWASCRKNSTQLTRGKLIPRLSRQWKLFVARLPMHR